MKCDTNMGKRPVKPDANEHRKIDGIVAGIMGLAGAMKQPVATSVYNSRGLLVA